MWGVSPSGPRTCHACIARTTDIFRAQGQRDPHHPHHPNPGRLAGRGRVGASSSAPPRRGSTPFQSPQRDRAAKEGLHRALSRPAGLAPWGAASAQRGRLLGPGGGAATPIAITPCEAAGDTAPGQDGPIARRGGAGRKAGDRRPRRQGTAGATIPRTWPGRTRWPRRRTTTVRIPTAESGGEGGLVRTTSVPGLNPCCPHPSGPGTGRVTDRHTGHSDVFCVLFSVLTV